MDRTLTRTALRRLGFAALGLLAAALALAFAALAYVSSPAGERRLRHEALQRINAGIQGRLDIAALQIHWTGAVDLRGIALSDPEGNQVARIDELRAWIHLPSLAAKRLRAAAVDARGALLALENQPGGVNLARALAPRRAAGPSRPPGLAIIADHIAIAGLSFRYRLAPGAPPLVSLDRVFLKASGELTRTHSQLSGEAAGEIAAPLAGPFALAVSCEGGSAAGPFEPLDIRDIALSGPSTSARLSGRLSRGHLTAQVADLAVPRALFDVLLPGHPLASNLAASGSFAVDARALSVDARAGAAGGGQVHIQGGAGLAPFAPSVTATFSNLDLARLFTGLPDTALNGRMESDLSGPSPRRGHLELDLAPSRVRGVEVASARASALLEDGQLIVRSFLADLPGSRVELQGSARSTALDLATALHLESASRFTAALERLFGVEMPRLDGRGELTARLQGPPKRPHVGVTGRLASLESGSFSIEGLTLQGEIPDAARPFLFRATAAAQRGRIGELPFTKLNASVQAERRAFVADLTTAGLAGLRAHLSGLLDADHRGARLEQLELAAKGSRWVMAAPTYVDLRSGFRVDGLCMKSGKQLLALRGGLSHAALSLSVEARRLELASISPLLPARLAPRGLAGRLDLDAEVSGSVQNPELRGRLRGKQLGVARFQGVDADLSLALGAQRISGRADLARGPSRAQVVADLPRALLRAPGSAPVSARARLERVDLGEIGRLLSPRAALSGTADLTLDLDGTMDRPGARAQLWAARATWADATASDVRLRLDSNGATNASLSAKLEGRPLGASVDLGMTLGALLRQSARRALLSAPLRATFFARGAPLSLLSGTLLPAGLAGAATLDGRVEGSPGAPLGEVHLSVDSGAAGRFTGLELRADVSTRGGEVAVASQLRWLGAPAAALAARIALAPKQWADRAALLAAPVEAHLSAGPVDLPSALGYGRELAAGSGSFEADLRGTLGEPILEVAASTSPLTAGGKSLGRLESRGSYRARKASLEAKVLPASGGSAAAAADLGIDLGLASLLAGLDWSAAPIDARLSSEDLDLKLLALLSPARQVMGNLTLSGEVTGTVGALRPRGGARLRGGQVAIPGFGTWREIDVDLAATDRRLEVSHLRARAGNGSLAFDAHADRASVEAPYELAGRLEVQNLPLIANDRLVAFVTGSTERLTGQLQDKGAAFEIRLGRVRAQLPELIGGKDLQPLEAHPDLFVRTGNAPTAKQLAAAAEPEPARGPGFALRVHLVAPNGDVILESSDLKAEAGADVNGVLASGRFELTGEAVLRQGRAEALGRRFEIRRSKLTWSSDPVNNPRLDLRATHENFREQVKVKVAITGTARRPRLELSSEPALDETEIATLIATGRRELKRGSGGVTTGSGAASVAGNYLASRLRRLLSNKVPLDVLQVEVGTDTRAQPTRVEAGTYLSDRIYLGYRRNFGADTENGVNANEVRVEYQISPRISVESEYGDQGRGGANVVYSRDY
jgi:translocation and assembly module TamB